MKNNAHRETYTDAAETQQNLYASELMATGTDGGSALKHLAAERLAAHRKRRAAVEARDGRRAEQAGATQGPAITAAAQRVRDAVAARYQQTPSFREYMAAEAEQAVQKTQADVETAARAAKAVADVQMQLMTELEQWPESATTEAAVVASAEAIDEDAPFAWVSGRVITVKEPEAFELKGSDLRVRHYEALPQPTPPSAEGVATNAIPDWVAEAAQAYHAEELQDLNEEIAFRLSPEFHEHLIEPLPIQANIIEFPRQLVAARKARPRIAEGPLRADGEHAVAERPAEFQMRIFEVEAEQISVTPTVPEETVGPDAPEWQSLMLGASKAPVLSPAHEDAGYHAIGAGMAASQATVHREWRQKVKVRVAPLELRVMSLVVDAICIGFSGLIFVTAAAVMTSGPVEQVSLPLLGASVAVLMLMLFVMYQGLFFSLGKSTPGMYYTNLVFRSIWDGEPTRSAMRKRVGANLLAALPLGLGLLWAVMDGDGLGWNDRLSGVYLREF